MLDKKISRMVSVAKLLERAYHDDGPWFLGFDQEMVPAEKEILDDSIVFRATSLKPFGMVTLYHQGDLVSARSIDGEAGEVEWWLRVPVSIAHL